MATMPPAAMMAAASARTSAEGRTGSMATRRMGTRASEADLHVLGGGHMDAVDEADAVRVVLHDDRARTDAVAEKAHALHRRALGDACGSEDDVVAGREILGSVDPLEVLDAHGAAALLVFRLADDQPRENLAVETPHGGGGQHALWRAARAHERVH